MTPRSSARPSFVPPGITAPGSATGTVCPAATLGAPQTIVRVAVAGLHLADAQPVGVGVALDREHPADHEAVRRGRPDVRDPLDLGGPQREQLAQLLDGQVGVAVLAQPGVRHPHRNCSSTRTSFSKNLRRSGTPCFSIAIRSIPIPNAKPWTRSGS